MNAQMDWNRWGSTWQERPAVDVERLRRQMQRKRTVTCVAITLKALLTLVMVIVLGYQMLEPATGLIWKIWYAVVIVLLLSSTCLTVHTLRGTWRVATHGVTDMLRLTVKRARAGIRLNWIGTMLFALLVAITVCVSTWWRLSPVWTRGPLPDMLAPVPIAAGCVGAMIAFAYKFIAIDRLRRQLREAEAWLREYTS